jgi:hypothetical protein
LWENGDCNDVLNRETHETHERFTLSASISFSASDGEKVAQPDGRNQTRRTNEFTVFPIQLFLVFQEIPPFA